MTITALKNTYEQRVIQNAEIAQKLRNKYNRYAIIRLVAFIGGIGLGLWISDFGIIPIALYLIGFIVFFGRFMIWHERIATSRRHHETLKNLNERELKYLNLETTDFDGGKFYEDALHPYAVDLDIFGDYSLFQYINRSFTSLGKERLADFLKTPANIQEIQDRQDAFKELSPKLNWRQDLGVYSFETEDSQSEIADLLYWLKQDDFITNKAWLRIAMLVLPILTLTALILSIFLIPYQIGVGLMIVQTLILRQYLQHINKTHAQTAQADKFLKKYARMIGHIENETFESEKLKVVQQAFFAENTSASKSLKQLSYIISQLNVRFNIFAFFLSVTVLWDFQWIKRLEDWKKRLQNALPEWFEALKEFEAINSLGTLHYNHPDWNFPVLSSDAEKIVAKDIGHPLIHRDKRINNDFEIPHKGHLKLVTGSNMAGKSTFLRTIGINIVLATTGAPVCAQRFELPLLEVYTSMRTQDALHESTSSFYAELKRLKVIIEAVETKENVFFLLDEILKGTNSNDRHKGSKALIQQLIKTKGMGIIATHDLDLWVLENEHPNQVENLCMEVEVNDQELVFDYKLKKGVSKSFNATYLMRNMGIRI
jgi:DNA mismatch repair ATPase MutS